MGRVFSLLLDRIKLEFLDVGQGGGERTVICTSRAHGRDRMKGRNRVSDPIVITSFLAVMVGQISLRHKGRVRHFPDLNSGL